jgi:hypothetical protein
MRRRGSFLAYLESVGYDRPPTLSPVKPLQYSSLAKRLPIGIMQTLKFHYALQDRHFRLIYTRQTSAFMRNRG